MNHLSTCLDPFAGWCRTMRGKLLLCVSSITHDHPHPYPSLIWHPVSHHREQARRVKAGTQLIKVLCVVQAANALTCFFCESVVLKKYETLISKVCSPCLLARKNDSFRLVYVISVSSICGGGKKKPFVMGELGLRLQICHLRRNTDVILFLFWFFFFKKNNN